jgi:spore coat polysaccharide biosynthesis protein SpsF
MLKKVYKKLAESTRKYLLIAEYYNPKPVKIYYRGHKNRLFKRDFAGEILKEFPIFSLIDYGFVYRNDPSFPQDDINWFLMRNNLTK